MWKISIWNPLKMGLMKRDGAINGGRDNETREGKESAKWGDGMSPRE